MIFCDTYTNPPNESRAVFSSYLNQYSHRYKVARLAIYDANNKLLLEDFDHSWEPIEAEYQELLNYILQNNL